MKSELSPLGSTPAKRFFYFVHYAECHSAILCIVPSAGQVDYITDKERQLRPFFFYSAIGLPFFIFFLHGETGDIGDIAIIANIATSKICTGTLGTLGTLS